MDEEIALGTLLTGDKFTELRNLGTYAYKTKCKWENRTAVVRGIRTSLYVRSIG
jgi:hypothetical protein